MIIEYAKNLVRRSQNTIDMVVKFAEFNQEIPFTACSCDCELHGQELYINAVEGLYGPIEE